jgi:hypothetical protein
MLPPPLPPSTADEIIDAVVAQQFYGYDALLPAAAADEAADAEEVTHAEWTYTCDDACGALFRHLETYARNNKHKAHAEAWFADTELRAEVLDTIRQLMLDCTTRPQLQHRGNVVLAELSERLTRHFCIATGQIRRPVPVMAALTPTSH